MIKCVTAVLGAYFVRCTHDIHSQSADVRRRSEKSPSFGFCQVDMCADGKIDHFCESSKSVEIFTGM